MQGKAFLGKESQQERALHFAFRTRMDERNENARAVCDNQFLYIRNYMPYTPWMQSLNYLWKMKATKVWAEHVQSGKASKVEERFFNPKGWTEELYDMEKDPKQHTNLAEKAEYAEVLKSFKAKLQAKIKSLQIEQKGEK